MAPSLIHFICIIVFCLRVIHKGREPRWASPFIIIIIVFRNSRCFHFLVLCSTTPTPLRVSLHWLDDHTHTRKICITFVQMNYIQIRSRPVGPSDAPLALELERSASDALTHKLSIEMNGLRVASFCRASLVCMQLMARARLQAGKRGFIMDTATKK